MNDEFFSTSSFILHPSYLQSGGGSRGRTGDIQLAKLALYQLSYAPGGKRNYELLITELPITNL